jgi:hypothetical protein
VDFGLPLSLIRRTKMMWYEGLFVLVTVILVCLFVFGAWDNDHD